MDGWRDVLGSWKPMLMPATQGLRLRQEQNGPGQHQQSTAHQSTVKSSSADLPAVLAESPLA